MPAISCDTNPTPRSEKARLRNSFFSLAVIDEAFNRRELVKDFPDLSREKTLSVKHREKRKKFLCNGQVEENLPTFDCSTVQPFFILPVVFQAFYLNYPSFVRFLK